DANGLRVGDAALHSPPPVAAGAHSTAVHVELVVVLAASEAGPGKSGANLETLAGGQAQHALGEIRLEAIEHGLAPAGGAAADGATHHAAQGVAVLSRHLDRRDHLAGHLPIRAAHGRGADLTAMDGLGVALGLPRRHRRYPR